MYIRKTIPTLYGPRRIEDDRPIRVTLAQEELHTLIVTLEQRSVALEHEGEFSQADRMATRAAILRRSFAEC